MITVVSWNIVMRLHAVEELLAMDADVAPLQEVGPGALADLADAGGSVEVSPQDPWEPWTREHYGSWPMVVKLSDRVGVQWFRQVLLTTPQEGDDEIAVHLLRRGGPPHHFRPVSTSAAARSFRVNTLSRQCFGVTKSWSVLMRTRCQITAPSRFLVMSS